MNEEGQINERAELIGYFGKCLCYGSMFILSREDEDERFVAEIKNINEGLDQLSLVPVEDAPFPFNEHEEINIINESGNITFKGVEIKNHAGKWLTLNLPASIKLINLRQSLRFMPEAKHILAKPSITSFGEEGLKKGPRFDASIADISETGVSLVIRGRRLDGIFRSDIVEMNLSEHHSFLSRLRGTVVHKSVANTANIESRYYKLGIEFKESLKLDALRN